MSKKTHIDVLGESFLPADLFTPSLGSGYGVGEYPDMEYGLGVLESGLAPSSGSGYRIEAQQAFDPGDTDSLAVTEMLKDGAVQDLSWLEVDEQDLGRLPDGTQQSLPELEEAWSQLRPITGVRLDPNNRDLGEVQYRQGQDKPKFRHSREDLARVVRKAMRQSAAGRDIREILSDVAHSLGEEAYRVRKAMQAVVAEHGLAGNVFIRASAYPGYEQGKWKDHLRRVAKDARYILVDEKTLKTSSLIQDGRCLATKKLAVTEIPWEEALAYYKPRLLASGRKVASGDPRAVLRAAFLSRPAEPKPDTVFPVHKAPVQQITREAAWEEFQNTPKEKPRVYDPRKAQEQAARKAAWRKIRAWADAGLLPLDQAMSVVDKTASGEAMLQKAVKMVLASKGPSAFSGVPNDVRPSEATLDEAKQALASVQPPPAIDISDRPLKEARRRAQQTIIRWVKAGFLSRETGQRLVQSKADPLDVLSAASRLVVAPREASSYSGVQNDVRVASEEDPAVVWASLREAEKEAIQRQKAVERELAKRLVREVEDRVAGIRREIERGVRGQALRDIIARSIPRGGEKLAVKLLAPVLAESGALDDTPSEKAKYQGPVYRPVPQKVSEVRPGYRETETLLRWLRQAMSEGFAGKELDALLEHRFSSGLRTASKDQVAALRAEHEGGAGFIYVDASAYASETGNRGCEEGARKHRTNGLKFVLAMDRCAECVLANPRPDGTRVCQAYNKILMTKADQPDNMDVLRRENIRAANMPDQELTASYFASGYDPSEFSLQETELSDILTREANEEAVGKILFGGLVWED